MNSNSVSMEQGHELGRIDTCLSDKIQVQEELPRDLGWMECCVRGQLTETLKLKTRKRISDGVTLSPD